MRDGKRIMHPALDLVRLDNQKIPGLHEANRWRVVCGRQDPAQYLIGNRCWQELATYIAAGKNGSIDRITCFLCERVCFLGGLRRHCFHDIPLM